LILSFLCFALLLTACSPRNEEGIAITHVTVIDGTGANPSNDFTVIVEEKRIAAVGPSSAMRIPNGARVIDGKGKFLIPGLADMHIHLTGAGEPGGSREFILSLLVANGITTVRDMGGKVELLKALRREINSGRRLGPQIFFTGPYLDGNPPSFQPSIVVQNTAQATDAVDKLASEGVDFIKVQSRLQPVPYYSIAEEAKRKEIRFVGHVPDSITAAAASDAGQASIEHLTGVLLGCSTREEELRRRQLVPPPQHENQEQVLERERAWTEDLLESYSAEKANGLFGKFLANQTWQVPTLVLLVDLGYLVPERDAPGDARLKYVPNEVRQNWRKTRDSLMDGRVAKDFEQRRALVKQSLETVNSMNKMGVRLMAGTDAAAPDVLPGFGLHEELALLVEAGLTPMQALQAATRSSAEFLGRDAQQGTIQPGKRADLVLLEANPLENIHNTQRIRGVILNGKLLDRGDLDAMLVEAEQYALSH